MEGSSKSNQHQPTVINLGIKRIGREPSNKIQFNDDKFKAIKCELKTTQHSVAKQMGSHNQLYLDGRRRKS